MAEQDTSSRRITLSRNEWHTADVHVTDAMMAAIKAEGIDLDASEDVGAFLIQEGWVDDFDFDSVVEYGPISEALFFGWEEFEPEDES